MIRRCIVCAIALLILVARLPSASADNATSTTDAERITLTVSPVFGDPQLLSDTVYTLDIASDTIMYQEIRQSDGAILDKDAFLAKSADVIALLQAIDEHLFFSLPDLIEAADVSDGAYCYLTVETRQTVKTCGGLNSYRSKNQDFVTIYEAFDRIWQNAQRIDAPDSSQCQKTSENNNVLITVDSDDRLH